METVFRFFDAPEESFFLFGPRGTGKSTWLKTNYPDALWVNLINPNEYREFILGGTSYSLCCYDGLVNLVPQSFFARQLLYKIKQHFSNSLMLDLSALN
jgi:hypothetical protein